MSVIWLNFAALLILIILMSLSYTKFRAPFQKYRVFLSMLWLATVSTLASICNNSLPGIAPVWVLQLSNFLYFLSHVLIPPAVLIYACSLTDVTLQNWRILMPIVIPTAFLELLVMTFWFTGTLYTVDAAGIYHRGPMMPFLYVISCVLLAGSGLQVLFRRNLIDQEERGSMLWFLVLSVGAMLVQFLFPQILVENFICAICLMISQLTVQNPERILSGGLLNKRGFTMMAEPLFHQNQQSFQIGFLIIDNYHQLEKSYGFTRLEAQIQILSELIQEHRSCECARLENGLFCFLARDIRSKRGCDALLAELENASLSARLRHEHVGIRFQIKVGSIQVPKHAATMDQFLTLVEMAEKLDMPKETDVMRLSASDISKLREQRETAIAVHRALKDGSLRVVYQPVYSLKEKRFVSAEALLRMNSRQLGTLSPGIFIPMVETSGAIVEMTQFVLETVCDLIRNTPVRALGLQHIHVNLSAVDCAHPDLSDRILECARYAGIDASALSVELTETAFSALSDSMLERLDSLSDAAITIMVDDFGTGYSNLNRLYSLPADIVKLDKSLLDDISVSEKARIVLEDAILMIQRLGKQVLVEGVETKEQADFLISRNIDFIQGFYYARPMDQDQLVAFFEAQQRDPNHTH